MTAHVMSTSMREWRVEIGGLRAQCAFRAPTERAARMRAVRSYREAGLCGRREWPRGVRAWPAAGRLMTLDDIVASLGIPASALEHLSESEYRRNACFRGESESSERGVRSPADDVAPYSGGYVEARVAGGCSS